MASLTSGLMASARWTDSRTERSDIPDFRAVSSTKDGADKTAAEFAAVFPFLPTALRCRFDKSLFFRLHGGQGVKLHALIGDLGHVGDGFLDLGADGFGAVNGFPYGAFGHTRLLLRHLRQRMGPVGKPQNLRFAYAAARVLVSVVPTVLRLRVRRLVKVLAGAEVFRALKLGSVPSGKGKRPDFRPRGLVIPGTARQGRHGARARKGGDSALRNVVRQWLAGRVRHQPQPSSSPPERIPTGDCRSEGEADV